MRKTRVGSTLLWPTAALLAACAGWVAIHAIGLGQQAVVVSPAAPASFRTPQPIEDETTTTATGERILPTPPDDSTRPGFGRVRAIEPPRVVAAPRDEPARLPEPVRPRASVRRPGNDLVTAPVQLPDVGKPQALARIPREEGSMLYPLQLTPPGQQQLFLLESEESFRERLRHEARERSTTHRPTFPESAPPRSTPAPARAWHGYTLQVEPSYVVSQRLFFEQPRFERYGHSLGTLQPAVSSGIFFLDTLNWPFRRLAEPCRWHQVNTDAYSPYFQRVGSQERNSDR